MLGRGTLALPLVLLAGACAGEGESESTAPRNDAGAPENQVIRVDHRFGEHNKADPPANEAMAEEPDPGLSGMTPYQRRAYDRGFGDCSAGRYDPDRYPESYRIGCAAAHDRGGGEPPQG